MNETTKNITIIEISQTLKNISSNLKGEELEAIECAIYIINKYLNGSIYYDEQTKIKIRTLIDNL